QRGAGHQRSQLGRAERVLTPRRSRTPGPRVGGLGVTHNRRTHGPRLDRVRDEPERPAEARASAARRCAREDGAGALLRAASHLAGATPATRPGTGAGTRSRAGTRAATAGR